MLQLNHREYYRVRAAASRALAGRASDPAIAAIHADFANRYDELAAQPDEWIDGTVQEAQAA